MNAHDLADLAAGFADPVHDAQAAFRRLLDAMSRPGTVQAVSATATPPGLGVAAAAVLLTVADPDVSVWLAPSVHADAQAAWLRFHTGARLAAAPSEADWLVLHAPQAAPGLWSVARPGSDEAPHTSATLLVDVPSLAEGAGLALSGPGIADVHRLAVGGLDGAFWAARAANVNRYPCGIDLVLASGTRLAAVPRSTRIALED